MKLRIDDLTITAEDWPNEFGHDYIWRVTDVPRPEDHSGVDESGRILVCLDVDGTLDVVFADLGQSGDVAAIERAIDALSNLRDGLENAYRGCNDPGRCLASGDWGRCLGKHGHEGDHPFPTGPKS